MHRLVFPALLAWSLPAGADTPGATVAALHQALASGDRQKASGVLAADIAIYESGRVERSRAEYASHHLPADIAFAATTTRKVLRHHERVAGALAVVTDETEITGTFKDKPVHLLGTETAVLERRGDSWVIVHLHWSSRKAK